MSPALPPSGDAERDELVGAIFALHDQLQQKSVELVGPLDLPPDLTMQQMRVLGAISRAPGMTVQELSTCLRVSAPTASGLVDRLVEKGLVTRADDAEDRRIRRLRLTPEGTRTLAGIDSMLGRLLETVLPPISTADLAAIRAGSEALVRAIEAALRARAAGNGAVS